MKHALSWFLGIFSMLFLNTLSHAASFNCKAKLNNVEKMICSDDKTSSLDDQLASQYKEIMSNSRNTAVVIEEQKSWLKKRNACKNANCLYSEYENRITQLRNLVANEYYTDGNYPVDTTASLRLRCEYQKIKSAENEIIEITSGDTLNLELSRGEILKKVFERKDDIEQSSLFFIGSDQSAECVFPSGNSIKIKVGSEYINPYGQCGADPAIYYSMWVNERKIVSSEQFSGHCMEPAEFNFNFRNGKITQCRREETSPGVYSKQECEDVSNINKYSIDKIEYPPAGIKLVKSGSVVLDLNNSTEICNLASNSLSQRTPEPFGDKPIDFPNQSTKVDYTKFVPSEIPVEYPDVFDFDNDGNLDLVYKAEFFNTYMSSVVLLVESGTSSKELKLAQNPFSNHTWYIPCQLSNPKIKLNSCPPLSQEEDEGGFEITVNNKEELHFRGRYIQLTPRAYKGRNYLWVVSTSADTGNYYAVLEPLPKKKFRPVCLMHFVKENF